MAEPQTYRFLRVLEYIGTAERLMEARERRGVKGVQRCGAGLTIYEGILGEAYSPATGQVRLKLCQMIVAADEVLPQSNSPDYCEGYLAACQELMALIEFQPVLEKNLG